MKAGSALAPNSAFAMRARLTSMRLARPRRHGHANDVAGGLDPKDGVTVFGRNPGSPMPPSIWASSAIGCDYRKSMGMTSFLGRRHGCVYVPAGRDPGERCRHWPDCCKLASDVDLFGGFEGNFEGTVPGNDGGCVELAAHPTAPNLSAVGCVCRAARLIGRDVPSLGGD
jgi:hypothetical protein